LLISGSTETDRVLDSRQMWGGTDGNGRWQCGDGAPSYASFYVGNVVTVLPATLLSTLAKWWRCSQLRFFLRWQSGDGAPSYASFYVGNVVTVLPATVLSTLAMWWRCSQLRFSLRWQCGDGARGYASFYVGNAVTVLLVTLLVTDVWSRPRVLCAHYDHTNWPIPCLPHTLVPRKHLEVTNEKESATAQFTINESVRSDRFNEKWTMTVSQCLNEHPGCQTIRAIQFCFTDKILKISMRSALCWKASGSIN
jgi:hypothetical protein